MLHCWFLGCVCLLMSSLTVGFFLPCSSVVFLSLFLIDFSKLGVWGTQVPDVEFKFLAHSEKRSITLWSLLIVNCQARVWVFPCQAYINVVFLFVCLFFVFFFNLAKVQVSFILCFGGSIHSIFRSLLGKLLPGGASGKESACQCRRRKRCGFHCQVRKIPCRRAWQPTPVFLTGESHGQRSLAGYSP